MVFKNRWDAGERLAEKLRDKVEGNKDRFVLLSLLRGGWVVGRAIESKLQILHLPLPVAKIPSPFNPEYAIGALCFEKIFIHDSTFSKEQVREGIKIAREKFKKYIEKFGIKREDYKLLKGKEVIIVDDGVATGSSAEAGALFAKQMKARRVILAAPVAPADFVPQNFDEEVILYKASHFSAVSQFYEDFSPVEEIDFTQ